MRATACEQAARILDAFAADTGLIGAGAPRRYLWTDAHAVCTWLALERESGDPRYLELAVALVRQVHQVLGRHRADDSRSGWISGLTEAEGAEHPTMGGLRIGKPRPERPPHEASDERAEWDQDGQYYHYLTKWMHALQQMAQHTGDACYRRWAVELAIAAHRGFRARSGPARLHWKMSIDLSYPLVASAGHHDPLDGLVTCLALRRVADRAKLDEVVLDLRTLCRGRSWLTDDPLGIGGLLFDAGRLAQLPPDALAPEEGGLLDRLLSDAFLGLQHFAASDALQLPATHRLAFRELGLAIGLQALDIIRDCEHADRVRYLLDKLRPYSGLVRDIEGFWLRREHRNAALWLDHRDINAVMLATSLVAPGFLSI